MRTPRPASAQRRPTEDVGTFRSLRFSIASLAARNLGDRSTRARRFPMPSSLRRAFVQASAALLAISSQTHRSKYLAGDFEQNGRGAAEEATRCTTRVTRKVLIPSAMAILSPSPNLGISMKSSSRLSGPSSVETLHRTVMIVLQIPERPLRTNKERPGSSFGFFVPAFTPAENGRPANRTATAFQGNAMARAMDDPSGRPRMEPEPIQVASWRPAAGPEQRRRRSRNSSLRCSLDAEAPVRR